ncbi:RNA-binding protein [Aspergillus lucknowensis]|uniref:RRM domain-containing protein n=1 Tax=Aspergillus lucknowensis TaxID=176173 RepID=A0ABR4LRI6_9EURO
MSEKKRKLEQNPSEDLAVTEREKKKAKKEGKKEKKRRENDVVDGVGNVEEVVVTKEKKKHKKDKKEKRVKKEKKSKSITEDREGGPAEETNGAEPEPGSMEVEGELGVAEESPKKKSKEYKKSKPENKRKEKEQSTRRQEQAPETNGTQEAAGPRQKAARFIVFVGNLPYSANTESLKAHFEKIQPISVRVATRQDDPTKCRGFGFVEFDNYDRMKTCLKLYHHSSFDDGKYPPRRINVELTAGGGGKSEHRKAKIEYKNQKLAEERKRQASDIQALKQNRSQVEETGVDPLAGVHPSRRMRMA